MEYNILGNVVNGYDYMIEDINQTDGGVWYLDYDTYKFPKILVSETKYDWNEMYTFPIKLLTMGSHRNISLYRL